MKRKIVAIVLSVMLVMAFGSVAYAADKPDSSAPADVMSSGSEVYEVVVDDPDKLAQIAKEEGLVAPEGQELVAVKTTYVKLPEDDVTDSFAMQSAAPMVTAASVSITNVRTTGYRYYSDDYDSFWYYGPYSLSSSYGQTRNAGYSSTYSVSSSAVSSAVGFSVTSSYYKSGSHSASVPSGQSLNLRVHMNYQVKGFDVYSSGTKVGSGSAWKPYSLIFKEYWYA
jgi:hypothetical protein